MTNSSFICYKLIDDIIKRGGQEVSDRYIIKSCLNKAVLSTKKILTNQMVKQSGVKSEYVTINTQMLPQNQPDRIRKDEYMSKSISKYQSKHRSKMKMESRRCVSSSKIKQRKQVKTAQTIGESKQKMITKRSKKENSSNLVELQDIKLIDKIMKKSNQYKVAQQLRISLIQRQKKLIQEQLEQKQKQEQLKLKQKKAKQNFNKQLNSGTTTAEHTYHIDGTFMVYSGKNKQKIISNDFPHTLTSNILNQKLVHQRVQSKQSQQIPIKTTQSSDFTQYKGSHTTKTQQGSMYNLDIKQSQYNNNKKRQISSIQFLNIKSGICYTQPNAGNSVRGGEQSDCQMLSFQQKKSSFQKFLSKDERSRTDGFLTFKSKPEIPRKNLISSSKTQSHSPKTSLIFSHKFQSSRTNRNQGKIKEVNQVLLNELVRIK